MQIDFIWCLWLDNDFYGGVYSFNYISDDNWLDVIFGGGFYYYFGDYFGEVIWVEYVLNSEKDF